jgi:hypothetical protein
MERTETVKLAETEQAGPGEVASGVDPALQVAAMVAQAEVLRIQGDLICSSSVADEDGRLRDLSPLGR